MILRIFSYYSFYLLFIFCIYYLYSNYNKKPKGLQKKKLKKHIINKGDIDKDRYSYRKIEDNTISTKQLIDINKLMTLDGLKTYFVRKISNSLQEINKYMARVCR